MHVLASLPVWLLDVFLPVRFSVSYTDDFTFVCTDFLGNPSCRFSMREKKRFSRGGLWS